MKQVTLKITENKLIADNVVRMVLEGDTSAITVPGQFINIALKGHFLRRPISVSDAVMPANADGSDGTVTILYKVVGEGTAEMAELAEGTELDVLTGLGNGFDISKVNAGETALLLGGGIGSAPMLMLTKQLKAKGVDVKAVLGFNSAADVILEEELQAAGAELTVMTADGSIGAKGFVTDAQAVKDGGCSYFYACGPMPMLKAVYAHTSIDGELSFEERMGCGFGACMGCTMQTASGPKRVCKDGPVFAKSEIMWEG